MADREKVIKETKDGIAFAESRGFGGLANTMRDALELLKQQEWISVSDRLPENAEHPGEFCPKVRVLTIWGETYGWYDPDVEAWYFLEWYTDFSRRHLDFERGDYPGIVYVPKDSPLITHWKHIL